MYEEVGTPMTSWCILEVALYEELIIHHYGPTVHVVKIRGQHSRRQAGDQP